jgi:hypothetical protein
MTETTTVTATSRADAWGILIKMEDEGWRLISTKGLAMTFERELVEANGGGG